MTTYHSNNLWVDWLSENSATSCYVINEFIESATFHLFALQVGHRVKEIEADAALPQLPEEQVFLLWPGHIWGTRERN